MSADFINAKYFFYVAWAGEENFGYEFFKVIFIK